MRKAIIAATLFAASTLPAAALEAYSAAEQQQFLDWCTGKRGASEGVCSCTLKQVAQTVPATALAGFLAQQAGGGGMSFSSLATTTAATTAASVTQALATCGK